MEMKDNTGADLNLCYELLASGIDAGALEEELRKRALSADSIAECLKEIRRRRNAKRQFTGFIYMGMGAFLGFLSCLLTVIQAFPQFHDFIFYGLTVIAILVVFAGLYLVFE